jgi:hypothetical protein
LKLNLPVNLLPFLWSFLSKVVLRIEPRPSQTPLWAFSTSCANFLLHSYWELKPNLSVSLLPFGRLVLITFLLRIEARRPCEPSPLPVVISYYILIKNWRQTSPWAFSPSSGHLLLHSY